MLRFLKHPFFWLHIFVFTILFIFFGKFILHPNAYVLNQWGDGIKNYFTPAWYTQYDKGTHFTGMNYPFGENVIYTDNQPILSWIIHIIDKNIYPIANYTVGIINSIIFLSFWLCAVFIFKILRYYSIPAWGAFIAAVLITFLNPQMDRITGHYALSYCFFIPLLWWLHIKLSEHKYSLPFTILLLCYITFFSFIHLYYLFLSALFTGTYACIELLNKKRFTKAFIINICSIIIPFLITFLIMHFTDNVSDRPSTPYGFFTYKASVQSVFMQGDGWLSRFLQNTIHMRSPNYEGYAYIGFASVCIASVSLFLFIKRSLKSKRISLLQSISDEREIDIYMLSAILSLLFSMAVPFSWGLQKLLDILPLIKQFRSPGRFAWIFYFVINIYTVLFIYKYYTVFIKRAKKITIIILSLLIIMACIECDGMLNKQIRITKKSATANPLQTDITYWTSVLTNNGYTVQDFQCILFVPFFLNGSEKFYIDRSGYDSGKAMEIAFHTGLPLIDGMLSRTSISQALQLAQINSTPLIKKPIKNKLTDKDILLITNEKELTTSEKYFLSKSKFIGQQAHLKFYSMPVNILNDTQDILIHYFTENKDSLFYSDSYAYYADDSIQLFYKNNFDTIHTNEPFRGTGSLEVQSGKISIAEIPVNIEDIIWAELSCWVKTYNETTAFPVLYANLLSADGTLIKRIGANAKFSCDVIDDWVRASVNFDIPANCKFISLEANDSKHINIDNIMLRHTAYDIFYDVINTESFFFNNYPIGN